MRFNGAGDLSFDILNENDADLTVTVQEYDCLYTTTKSRERTYELEPSDEWHTISFSFTPDYYSRYIEISIEAPYGAYNLFVDNISMGEKQLLISKITDTIGRTIKFDYGNLAETVVDSTLTVTITEPGGENSHAMFYNRTPYTATTEYMGMSEQRYCWYLDYANTEGNGNIAYYEYLGGYDDKTGYTKLYTRHDVKTQSASLGFFNKPVLSGVRKNNRKTIFEYEKTRKNLGTRGFYDSLRVKHHYQQYATTQNNTVVYEGLLNEELYSYSGIYDGVEYSDETGYPNYNFDADTTFGEQWTFIKKTDIIEKSTLSNGVVTKIEDETNGITNEFAYDSDFKDLPILITHIITNDGQTKVGYVVLSYNNDGSLVSESKYVSDEIYSNPNPLEKYTTHYAYDGNGNVITETRNGSKTTYTYDI